MSALARALDPSCPNGLDGSRGTGANPNHTIDVPARAMLEEDRD